MNKTIRKKMATFVEECREPLTGEVNATKLAEETAIALDHDEWLDDPDHEVWEIALTFE